jgi:hypothetical protein
MNPVLGSTVEFDRYINEKLEINRKNQANNRPSTGSRTFSRNESRSNRREDSTERHRPATARDNPNRGYDLGEALKVDKVGTSKRSNNQHADFQTNEEMKFFKQNQSKLSKNVSHNSRPLSRGRMRSEDEKPIEFVHSWKRHVEAKRSPSPTPFINIPAPVPPREKVSSNMQTQGDCLLPPKTLDEDVEPRSNFSLKQPTKSSFTSRYGNNYQDSWYEEDEAIERSKALLYPDQKARTAILSKFFKAIVKVTQDNRKVLQLKSKITHERMIVGQLHHIFSLWKHLLFAHRHFKVSFYKISSLIHSNKTSLFLLGE